MRYNMYEGGNGCGCGRGCGCCDHNGNMGMEGRMGMRHMHGMGNESRGIGSEMHRHDEFRGPLHAKKLVEKLKLYKEDLEEQAKFVGKRIEELEKESKDVSEEKDE